MAEILYPDGRREIVSSGPEQTEIRAPSTFERYRGARQGITEKALGMLPLPGSAASDIAGMLTPQTRAEQGIEIGLGAMPLASKVMGPAARFGERMIGRALPAAVGGATGGAMDRPGDPMHSLWEGARGVAYSALGDVPAIAKAGVKQGISWLGRDKVIEKADAAALGQAIEKAVPMFGKLGTKGDIDAIGIRRRGLNAMTDFRKTMVGEINDALAGRKPGTPGGSPPIRPGADVIEVPALRGLHGESAMSFDKALDWLTKLSDGGWVKDQLARGLDAAAARSMREQARDQMVRQLDARTPGLGARFDRDMNHLARGHLFVNLLRDAGAFNEKGRLDMNAIRNAMGKSADGVETYAQRLEKLAPEEARGVYAALQRGASDLTARDVQGGISARGHVAMSGRPHVWISPHLGERVGSVPPMPPFRVGSGGTPTSMGLLGLSREALGQEGQ